jgi:hypothetical protein
MDMGMGGIIRQRCIGPSVEVARKKITVAWDRRIEVSVSRPGFWAGEPWVADETSVDTWAEVELGGVVKPVPPAETRGTGAGIDW